MEPKIKEGSFLIASSIPFLFSKPKVGDIILFDYGGKTILKRIKKNVGEKYSVAGDNKKDSMRFDLIDRYQIREKVIHKI